uniref:U11/U12 small nuclear ribonucleoprotein 25 kDa protein-like isoform X2 n=1 Tax=Tanacetum cinerariifolium TaxID=118510 RepID=A0A699HIG4_TANCI|nr:U11/U12 small nuclear ribonucleoprotein 25 kDa protein-like isoform X2 [Tanacetum cinerariifolium]
MQKLAENNDDLGCDHNKYSFQISGSNSASLISPLSPLRLIETLHRKSFSSYGKLPIQPIRLSVLKLDGSSFDISVVKNPTVAQLKQAVEDAFSHLPKHGIGKISWSHVWAQFCLCYEGQKLLLDQDNVGLHGIKDGDQLQFVRHTSTSYNFIKGNSVTCNNDLEESKATPSKQEVHTHEQYKEERHHSSELGSPFQTLVFIPQTQRL